MIFAHTSHGQFPNHFHQVQQQKTEISLNSLKIDFQIINEIYCQLFHIMNNQYFCLRWIKVKTVLYKFPTANKTGNWVTNACKSIFPFIEFVHNFFDQNFKKELFCFCPGVTVATNRLAVEVLLIIFLATGDYLHAD